MMGLILRAIIILAVASAIGLVHGMSRGLQMPPPVDATAIPRIRTTPTPPPTTETPTPEVTVQTDPSPVQEEQPGTFTAQMLKDLIDTGSALVIDARSEEAFAESHIPQAMHLPVENISTAAGMDVVQLILDVQSADPEMQVVIYCDGGDCHASELVGRKLREYTVENVFVFTDGFPAWQQAGFELE